jgi:AraC-like DNA-binding protein
MSKEQIRKLIEDKVGNSGLIDTGLEGVQVFRITESVDCAPAVYEPTVVAIVGGAKEAILDGKRYVCDSSQYMCCPVSMPVEAGTPTASVDNPLVGVFIALDARVMTDLAIETQSAEADLKPRGEPTLPGLALANWDDRFGDALLRLLQIADNPSELAVLGQGRLRELYYAVLKGEAGDSARRAFGVGNDIARAIEYLSSNLHESVSIDGMATQVGMSRAVFHRKFKQATSMSPIQSVKAMRLNRAAMKIAGGMNVNLAAAEVGYASYSQFSREFKRQYGQSPKQWSTARVLPAELL